MYRKKAKKLKNDGNFEHAAQMYEKAEDYDKAAVMYDRASSGGS